MEKTQNKKLVKKKRSTVTPTPSKKQKIAYIWLNVLPDDLWLKVRQGETVWNALQESQIELSGECGGLGKCGKCKIRVISAIGPPSNEEEELLDDDELVQGVRLACRTQVNKDLVIHIGGTVSNAESYQILKSGHRPFLNPLPLITKRLVTLPPELQNEGLSDLDLIKMVMVPEYDDMGASLHCLRMLPRMLAETEFHGAAVLHGNNLIAWQNWAEVNCHFGLVFDLGTSTLVGKLINLVDGVEASVVSWLNSQMKYGTNVISRLN